MWDKLLWPIRKLGSKVLLPPAIWVGKKWVLPAILERILKEIQDKIGGDFKMARTKSQAGALSVDDLLALFRGGLIAGIGALLTYITEGIPGVDLGGWTPIVVAAWSFLANLIRKYIEGPPDPPPVP